MKMMSSTSTTSTSGVTLMSELGRRLADRGLCACLRQVVLRSGLTRLLLDAHASPALAGVLRTLSTWRMSPKVQAAVRP